MAQKVRAWVGNLVLNPLGCTFIFQLSASLLKDGGGGGRGDKDIGFIGRVAIGCL